MRFFLTASPMMKPLSTTSPKLLDRLRLKLRANHNSFRTEQADVHWVERFLRYHRDFHHGVWRHPRDMGMQMPSNI